MLIDTTLDICTFRWRTWCFTDDI